ncbi:uncharacterized protein LOC108907210 [Anoplophora glabripennis]|uniref:uncharacterized protein LOC108907210 n=1 Tax=Anoplophora glabripennis TaxID=217634 RepID=UPI0008740BB7|nr:uncharacterized protein LOC108907210 [Anoplophora glabripennis]
MPSSPYLAVLLYILDVSVGSASNSKVVRTDVHPTTLKSPSENVTACGEVHIGRQFTLTSPNYPKNYSANLDCHYLLKGPHCPTYYQFEFVNFSVEGSENCAKDRFVVGDQDVLCGNKNKTKAYFAVDGSLHVRFKTDENGSGSGYLIRVIRRVCEKILKNVAEATKNETKDTTHERTKSSVPSIQSRMFIPKIEETKSHCCGTVYSSKRFVLTSPNFPYTLNKKTECSFEIHKANNNICRLRLNFLFFWISYTDRNNCPYGYLEIDGKYICGCNSDLKLTTAFGDSSVKTLKFKTEGHSENFNTGFVIEVIQDECPKKYSPENVLTLVRNGTHYKLYNDQINRVAWPSDAQNFVEKLQLINERTEILDEDQSVIFKDHPKVVKSIYVFAAPEYNDFAPSYQDKEGTTYLDLSSVNSVLTNTNYYQCLGWNQMQYKVLNAKYGKVLTCPRNDENDAISVGERDCVDLSYVSGYFRSPGYPCYYPKNLNVCYRLKKQPGYCTIKVFVQDFQIENSFHCTKDYFLLANGEKHCGNSLNKASWLIDLRNKDYEDMIFVTDGYYCARGFSGVYQQIACQDEFPVHPVDTTTAPIIPTTPANDYCNKIISQKSFTMEVNGDHKICTFSVQKFDKNVCKINFYLEKFDLVCGVESLLIDGTMYCGHLSGRIVKVNVNNTSTNIVFRSTLERKFDDLRFKIRGEQISDDCLFIGVPDVQRLVNKEPEIIKLSAETSLSEEEFQKNSKYLIAFVNKNFKDICGIVTNSTMELPSSFCEILTKNHNATKCVPLRDKVTPNVPYQTKKLGIELQNKKVVKEIQEVEIREIDCDNLQL